MIYGKAKVLVECNKCKHKFVRKADIIEDIKTGDDQIVLHKQCCTKCSGNVDVIQIIANTYY